MVDSKKKCLISILSYPKGDEKRYIKQRAGVDVGQTIKTKDANRKLKKIMRGEHKISVNKKERIYIFNRGILNKKFK